MNIHINTSKLWYTLWINLIDLTLDTIAPGPILYPITFKQFNR